MIKDNPTLEDCLDGLYHAHVYALDIGEEELASEIFDLYQEMGEVAPEEDWDWTAEEDGFVGADEFIEGMIEPEEFGDDLRNSLQESMTRNPLDEEEDYD